MTTLKNTLSYRFAGCIIVAVALLTTCDKPIGEENLLPPIVLSGQSSAIIDSGISFPSDAPQAVTLKFTASRKWSTSITDTKSSSWLTVDPSKGEPGDVTMTVLAVANEGKEDRSSQVTIQCDTVKIVFKVAQAGKPVIHVNEIKLDPEQLFMAEGEIRVISAAVIPDNATDKTVLWTSSDGAVATVTEGIVTAIKEGSAVITATADGKSATCAVTVNKTVVDVESVTLNKTSLELKKGDTETLVATVLPEDATDKTVTWSSSDPSVASVVNGKVTAIEVGTAVITATADGKSATCAVTVNKTVVDVESVTLNKTSLELKKGDTETLVATVLPEDATDKTVTWSSSDPSVASVVNGKVTAIEVGTAVITAKVAGKTASCQLTILPNGLFGDDPEGFQDEEGQW